MPIRPARAEDLPELVAIYNREIECGTATFDTDPVSVENRGRWLAEHNVANHPLLVAEVEGNVVGYASLSAFNPKRAYAATVELSVYVDHNHRGRGLGRRLADAVIEIARSDAATRRIVSLVTAENTASMHLHAKLGFRHVGTLTQAGEKFGRLLDVALWELAV